MKILHIGPDSHFTQYLGDKFEEVAPKANIFVSITTALNTKYPIHGARNILAKPNSLDFFRTILPIALSMDAIVAHGLTREAALLIGWMRKPAKIWSGWGYDYYRHGSDAQASLLAPITSRYAQEFANVNNTSPSRQVLMQFDHWVKRRAASSADFFSAPIPSDYDVMVRSFPEFAGAYAQLNYGDVATMFSAGIETSSGTNVLVGNSASLTNNHEDVFERLADCNLVGRKIIVPLSYGDTRYRDHVMKRGKHYFGKAFQPLVHFMPLIEYVGVISSCNVVLMGHKRQQALGNIGSAIYHGANVYLDSECPTYKFFNDRGVAVSTLDELDTGLPTARKADAVVDISRETLHEFWGTDVVVRNVTECISLIASRMATRAGMK